jgi:polysaccharide lyase-like protein
MRLPWKLALFLPAVIWASGQAVPASPGLLADGFDNSDFAEAGGLYYKNNAEQDAGTVEFQSEVTRSGTGALKLTVKSHCDKVAEGCSERAEIWERPELWVPYDQGVWYGFAVKFAQSIPQDDHRYVIAQWKRQIAGTKGDFSPFLALRLNKGKLFATVETNLVTATRLEPEGQAAECRDGEAAVWLRPKTNQTRALVATDRSWAIDNGKLFNACTRELTVTDRGNDLPAPGSGWIDFAIYSKPGPDGTGHIEIFANNLWIATIKGRIGHAEDGLGAHQYFKFGPYRDAHDGTWTLYYDDFRRSPECSDVLDSAACPF